MAGSTAHLSATTSFTLITNQASYHARQFPDVLVHLPLNRSMSNVHFDLFSEYCVKFSSDESSLQLAWSLFQIASHIMQVLKVFAASTASRTSLPQQRRFSSACMLHGLSCVPVILTTDNVAFHCTPHCWLYLLRVLSRCRWGPDSIHMLETRPSRPRYSSSVCERKAMR